MPPEAAKTTAEADGGLGIRKQRRRSPEESPPGTVIEPESVKSQGGATLTKQADGSYLASGTNPASDAYVIAAPMPDAPVSALAARMLPDASLPNQSLGRAFNGNFVLAEFEVDVMSAETGGNPVQSKIAKAQADYSQKGWDITNLADRRQEAAEGQGLGGRWTDEEGTAQGDVRARAARARRRDGDASR